jgi:SAM-dependent methyltransferase
MDEPDGPNFREIAYWNSEAVDNWTAQQERMDATLAPVAAAALARAAPVAGERVIDVGCGCGATLLALAAAVGPQGHVLGVDISRPMLDRARERAAASGLAQVSFVQADASLHAFPPAAADLVFSRFGVMFFRNPVDAFANLRRAARPGGQYGGGRLLFAAWRGLDENPYFNLSLRAALALVPPPPRPAADEPGPFAFADPERVRGILEEAGWHDMALERCDLMLRAGPPGGAAEAAALAVRVGPASRALADAPQSVREEAQAAVEAVLARHDGPEGIMLPASVWLVSARA